MLTFILKFYQNKFLLWWTILIINTFTDFLTIVCLITQSLNQYCKTKFRATCFGNVLGSIGSVMPLFRKQIENGGPATVTDDAITRFFMAIPESCNLVLKSGAMGEGGDAFVFDMG